MECRRLRVILVTVGAGVDLLLVDLSDEIIHEIRRDRKLVPLSIGSGVRDDLMEPRAHLGDFEIVFRIHALILGS